MMSQIKQLYNSSMQFLTNDGEILSPTLNKSMALRRNVRIKSSKLPPDFFMAPHIQRYVSPPILSRQIGTDILNRQLKTPSFHCHRPRTRFANEAMELERKVETARNSLEKIENQYELFSVILSTSNKLRKVVRKQSLDMKQNCSMSLEDKHFRLPKLLHRASQRH